MVAAATIRWYGFGDQPQIGADDQQSERPRISRMNADERTGQILPDVETTRKVIGAFYRAYNEIGFGFLESVYHEALAITLTDAKVRFVREPALVVRMRGRPIGLFRPDFIVEDRIIIEVKVARRIDERHHAQLLNYLRASDVEVGLLLNFGREATFRRMIFSNAHKQIRVHPRPSVVDQTRSQSLDVVSQHARRVEAVPVRGT